ncbi:MAG: hypothetical protein WDM85_18155 [Caulobacteraceae bacterium]
MAGAAVESGPARSPRAGRRHELLKFGLVVLAVWLAGQIVTLGAADHYAADRPAAAVLWRGDSPDALTSLAQRRLIARDPGHAALLARRALEEAPLQVAALSALGVALDEAGQADRAETVMTFAGSRGWRDALAQYWLFGHRLQERRYPEAFARADALLRRADQFRPQLLAVLTAVADTEPAALPALADRLKAAPDWRPAFLAFLCAEAHPQSEAAAYALLTALARGPTPADRRGDRRIRTASDPAAPIPGRCERLADAVAVVGGGPACRRRRFRSRGGARSVRLVRPERRRLDRLDRRSARRWPWSGAADRVRRLRLAPAYAADARPARRRISALRACLCRDGCGRGSLPLVPDLHGRRAAAGAHDAGGDSARSVDPVCGGRLRSCERLPGPWLQLTADQGDHHTDIVVWFDDIAVARR